MRDLSPLEIGILRKLLSIEFPGRDALTSQLPYLRVKEEWGPTDLSVSLETVAAVEPADVVHRVPVEGSCADRDGTLVQILLHVVDGVAAVLEIYRADSEPLVDVINPEELELFSVPRR